MEMGRARALAFCLAAALAIGVVGAAASASAFKPEWGQCLAVEGGAGGRFANEGCTEKAKKREGVYRGAFEWTPMSVASKEGTMEFGSGGFTFQTQAGERIVCEDVMFKSVMSFLPRREDTPLWGFYDCLSGGEECNTTVIWISVGEIGNWPQWEENGWSNPAQLRVLEGAGGPEPVVGVGFKERDNGSGEPERFYPAIACEGPIGTVVVGGNRHGGNGVIGALEPVNRMGTRYSLTYRESAPGVQSPERFPREASQYLQAFVRGNWERMALVGTISFELEGRAELKATP